MPASTFESRSRGHITALKEAGTYKSYRHLSGPMGAHSPMVETGGEVIVLSSNNYLGLANHPRVVKGAAEALHQFGAGTASVRFICGTMTVHQQLENTLARFHGTEAALTYSSCWAANTGLFATITQPGDVLISDELNHASIIDGCRLTGKDVTRAVYRHADMAHLEQQLKAHMGAPCRFIITDGVFSMEGDIADLPGITALAEKYNAVVVVDDSHGVGVMGKGGRGVAEHYGLEDKIDIYTGTLGKALGGAAGGYVAASAAVVDLLVQASRPHIFSNGISPATAGAATAALELIMAEPERLQSLRRKTAFFRAGLVERGFKPLAGESAIVPIIVGETAYAIKLAGALLEKGIFITGFGFPVVPEGKARLRVQISDALSEEDMTQALDAMAKVGRALGLLKGAA